MNKTSPSQPADKFIPNHTGKVPYFSIQEVRHTIRRMKNQTPRKLKMYVCTDDPTHFHITHLTKEKV